MNRDVQMLPRAKRQLYDAALWWAENRSAADASRWLEGMEYALQSLAENPERYPLAHESASFDFPL